MTTFSPNMPLFEAHNLTKEKHTYILLEVNKIHSTDNKISYLPFLVTPIAAIYFYNVLENNGILIISLLIIFFVTSGCAEYIQEKHKDFQLNRIKSYKEYESYENAMLSYNLEKRKHDKEQQAILAKEESNRLNREREVKRKQHTYWVTLDPYEFENEVAIIFKKQGYSTQVTKGSGDGGIDILLDKNGNKGIVQCKRYKNKVGPGPIRDLFGTMKAGRYTYGYVVCPSGFSDKAFEFSKGKNIKLIGLKRIMEMTE